MDETTPTVLVVDEDVSTRAAIRSLLESEALRVIFFSTTAQFLASSHVDAPACLVMDVPAAGKSALDLQRELASHDPELPIVCISGQADIPTSVRAIKAGAVEFLTKPLDGDEFRAAVHEALARSRHTRRLGAELTEIRERIETLTPRERQVMTHVVAGMPNKKIAHGLGISEVTVKIHRGHVMHKMMAESVPDLVRMNARVVAANP